MNTSVAAKASHVSTDSPRACGTNPAAMRRRVAELCVNDEQFAAARPSEAINKAIQQGNLRLVQIVQTVMEGYADRPALGQCATRFVSLPAGNRTRRDRRRKRL